NSILANAKRICEAKFAHLLLYDGDVFRAAAFEGASPAFVEFWQRGPHALDPETGPRRAVETKQIVHVPDLQQTDAYRKPHPQLGGRGRSGGGRLVSGRTNPKGRRGNSYFEHIWGGASPVLQEAD